MIGDQLYKMLWTIDVRWRGDFRVCWVHFQHFSAVKISWFDVLFSMGLIGHLGRSLDLFRCRFRWGAKKIHGKWRSKDASLQWKRVILQPIRNCTFEWMKSMINCWIQLAHCFQTKKTPSCSGDHHWIRKRVSSRPSMHQEGLHWSMCLGRKAKETGETTKPRKCLMMHLCVVFIVKKWDWEMNSDMSLKSCCW